MRGFPQPFSKPLSSFFIYAAPGERIYKWYSWERNLGWISELSSALPRSWFLLRKVSLNPVLLGTGWLTLILIPACIINLANKSKVQFFDVGFYHFKSNILTSMSALFYFQIVHNLVRKEGS